MYSMGAERFVDMSSSFHYSLPFRYDNGNEMVHLSRETVQKGIKNRKRRGPGDSICVVPLFHYSLPFRYNNGNEVVDLKRDSVQRAIENKIQSDPEDSIYVPGDFSEFGNYNAVKEALSRLVEEKALVHLMRGMYKRPHFNSLLKEEMEASPADVAKALANRNRWTIIPSGDTALNYLGLTTQVPATYHFVSDGMNKEVELNNGITLYFKHVPSREITGISPKSALVIEAIKAIGKKEMSESVRHAIRNSLSEEEMDSLVREKKTSRVWIAEEIRRLLGA